jgi:formate/nitrite transporter
MAQNENNLALVLDAYAPAEIAQKVETAGIAKAHLSTLRTLTLSVLAGAYISFGAMLFVLAMVGSDPGFGPARIFGGFVFSLGLVLVVIAGAELFTGNNLIVFAWADGKITLRALLRNWGLVYLGNAIGVGAMVVLSLGGGVLELMQGGFGETANAIANGKVALSPLRATVSGVLCNVLVCLAVWMCFSARRVTGKAVCVIFPVTAFVALGFEHSIANMYLIPMGLIADGSWDIAGLFGNIFFVSLGNIIGGGGRVAAVYWIIYRRA